MASSVLSFYCPFFCACEGQNSLCGEACNARLRMTDLTNVYGTVYSIYVSFKHWTASDLLWKPHSLVHYLKIRIAMIL